MRPNFALSLKGKATLAQGCILPAICILIYQKLFKLYQNISEEGYWESDIESILTVNVEVHTIKEIALSDKRIGSLTHQTLANMVHFGSKTEDAHCGIAIAWSLWKKSY